jgi:class 3 adenylate cyclase
VEEATRITGDEVLLTEATRALLRRDHGGFAGRGDAELKGKTERVRLHAPLAGKHSPSGRGSLAGVRPEGETRAVL